MVLARRFGIGIAPDYFHIAMEMIMKSMAALLIAAGLMLSSAPSHAVVLDLSTMSYKQFLEGGDDTIKMVLTWMDGW